QERAQLYARVLGIKGGVPGAPDGATGEAEPNRSFISLWLRFVVSVAMFSCQHSAQALLMPPTPANSRVRHAARALAANASVHGAAFTLAAARQLAAEVEELIILLGDADLVGA